MLNVADWTVCFAFETVAFVRHESPSIIGDLNNAPEITEKIEFLLQVGGWRAKIEFFYLSKLKIAILVSTRT